MSKIVDWFTHVALVISGGIEQIAVVLVSMLPLIELRGGIPIGIKLGMGTWEAFGWAFLGSSIICVPLLLILKPIFTWAKKKKSIGDFFTRVENVFKKKARIDETGNNNQQAAEKRTNLTKILTVFIFSLVPIPGAGVWTASLIAVLLGLKFGWSVLSIAAGNLIDGLIILGLTSLIGAKNLDYFLFALFAVAVIVLIYFIYKVIKQKPTEDVTSRTSDK